MSYGKSFYFLKGLQSVSVSVWLCVLWGAEEYFETDLFGWYGSRGQGGAETITPHAHDERGLADFVILNRRIGV